MRGNLVAGAILGALGLAVAFEARRFPGLGDGHPGPGLFPMILGALLAGLGLALLMAGWRRRAPASPGPPAAPHGMLRAAGVAVSVVIYLGIAPRVGFALSMAAVLLLNMVLQGVAVQRSLAAAVVTTAVMNLLFRHVLRVPLPTGPWGL
jgi:hypothetical protein